ncbi:hypothetical protein SCOCK_180028 [Actinacidiphila cocklensis]|uniref:Uncharacterized protein n=1 Tax=Actinacidiphila cocklensis TaxID=887465 RepID=A0A9W4DMF9_9ACTN|nr:hypothetical protein SCOCK_180028 [Actinacidiphila cocklensis]
MSLTDEGHRVTDPGAAEIARRVAELCAALSPQEAALPRGLAAIHSAGRRG